MSKSFFDYDKPLITTMIQTDSPEKALKTARLALDAGADAIGIQFCQFKPEYQNSAVYRDLFSAIGDVPTYVTYYRGGKNTGKSDDELAEGMLELSKCGASLVDVMGDLFCKDPDELTVDPTAIEKQKQLIDNIDKNGAKVLMSSHTYKFRPDYRVLEIAKAQVNRGADYVKIVTGAYNMQQQIENLRITDMLKQNLDVPFLFLSLDECHIHRMIGTQLGCGMCLTVYEHDELATPAQPLIKNMKAVLENF